MPTNREIKFILRLRDEASNQFQKFHREVSAGIGRIKTSMRQFGALLVGAFSISALKSFVEASNKQEEAIKMLDVALRNQGNTSEATRKRMIEYASALQRVTTVGDEVSITIMGQMTALTGLGEEAILPLTKATLDLAAGMSMDAEAVGNLVAKTLSGQDALGRYGISLKGATTQSEKMALLLDIVNQKFGGMAEALAGTTAGKIKQFNNLWGDMKESIGDLVKGVLAELLPTLQKLVQWFIDAPTAIKTLIISVGFLSASFAALGISMGPVALAIIGLTSVTGALIAEFNEQSESMRKAKEEILGLKEATDSLLESGDRYAKMTKDELKRSLEELKFNLEIAEGGLDSLKLAFQVATGHTEDLTQDQIDFAKSQLLVGKSAVDVKDKYYALLATTTRLRQQIATVEQHLRGVKDATTGASKTTNDYDKEIRDLTKSLGDLVPGSQEYIETTLAIIRLNMELERVTLDANIAAGAFLKTMSDGKEIKFAGVDLTNFEKSIDNLPTLWDDAFKGLPKVDVADKLPWPGSIDEITTSITLLEEKLRTTGMDTPGFDNLRERLDEMKSKLDWALLSPFQKAALAVEEFGRVANRVLNITQRVAQGNADLELETIDRNLKRKTDAIDAELEGINITEERRQYLIAQRAKAEEEAQNKIAAVKRRIAESQKTAAIISSIINTAEGVTKALAQGGFFGGPWMAAVVAALGAAETAVIASQPIPEFHEGTGDKSVAEMIASAPPGKEFPILVRGGETIRTEEQEKRLRSASGPVEQRYEDRSDRSVSLVFNINVPMSDDEYVMNAIEKRLRRTGLTIDKIAVNRRRDVVIKK